MREYGSNINLPSLDNLFSSEQERQDAKLEKIQILPLTELHPFRNHPFQVRDDDEMDKMVDSIKEYGVMTPAIVRPRQDGGYEIVAGHRRCHASQRAGVETMPCIVRDMDDDTAIILMVDSNCQREHMLKLPVPALVGGKPTNIQLKPSEIQKQMVTELGERADKIRNKMVKPYEDNMLKITNDGRKLALDQRLIDPDLPDDPDSKVNICVGKIFEIWEQTMPQRSAQLVFCDLSTPKAGVFNVYDDMKAKLIERGIPETEIAFIHEANTDARKTELFGKVRSGAVRVLMGSTAKMGAGTNVQQRLVALHHLDVPWRPSDIEQREGRILRQGNENKEVYVFRYVTEGTFDAYSWVRHEVA